MIVLVKYFEVYREVLLFQRLCFVRFFMCKLKFNLVSNTILRCFWEENDLKMKFWSRNNGGWLMLLIFLLRMTSWAYLLGSGLKFIFHWKAQSLILPKSLFKLVLIELIFWTTEKREVSSGNSFWFEVKSSDISLI